MASSSNMTALKKDATDPEKNPEGFFVRMLDTHRVVLISATYCTFCTRLKALLLDLQVHFVSLEINVLPNGRAVFEEVVFRSQCHTVPQVFIRGQFVGGYDEILTLHHKGELLDLINGKQRA